MENIMKNTKIAFSILAASLLGGSFAVQAHGNGDENVQSTKSYQSFVQSQATSGEIQGDSSVFQNHDSNH